MNKSASVLAVALVAATAALGCSAADPIDLGNDFSDAPVVEAPPPPADIEPESNPETGPVQPGLGLDAELSGGKGASPYCQARFEACGGDPTGYWEVEDTCNPETTSPKTRRIWGRARMALTSGACARAVERLTAAWSGNLDFVYDFAIDTRLEQERVEIAISRACLEDTLGLVVDAPLLPQACATFQDDTTTCTASGGTCYCSAMSERDGDVIGAYQITGERMLVGEERYDFCAQGDHLLWREPGSTHHLVLRRRLDPGPASPGDIDIPR